MTPSNPTTYPVHAVLEKWRTIHMLRQAGLSRESPARPTLTVEGELTAADCGNLFGPVPDIQWHEILGKRAEATGQLIRLADAWGPGRTRGWAQRLTELLSRPPHASDLPRTQAPQPKQPEQMDADTAAALVRLTATWPDSPYILEDDEVRRMLADLQLDLRPENLVATIPSR